MRNLTLIFFLAIVLHLVVGVGGANALPQCTDPSYRHNCEDTVTYPSGAKYVGAFKDNKRHGQGTFTYADGEKYVGAFKDAKFHGQGTLTDADGNKYVGAFKDDKFHGQGTLTAADGNKYVGAFKDDKRHGQGTEIYTDERKYVGAFKDDKRHGQGTFTHADGSKYVGDFKDKNPMVGVRIRTSVGTSTLASPVTVISMVRVPSLRMRRPIRWRVQGRLFQWSGHLYLC